MLIWDDAQTICQDWSGDSSAATLTKFKRYMNLGYKDILHTFGGEEGEDVRTTTTLSGSRAIKLPPNYIRIHTVVAIVGNQEYPIYPEESQEAWTERVYNNRSSSRPTTYFIRPRFGVAGTELLLDPIPSNSTTTIKIYYSANARDLANDQYTTGTVAVTNDSPTVTGTGTVFSQAMEGRYFRVGGENGDGMWYRITDYVSGTSITLENDWQSYNISGKSFVIAEAFALPEDLQMAPIYYAMWHYYAGDRKDRDEMTKSYWQGQYRVVHKRAEDIYKRKGKSNFINTQKPSAAVFPVYPFHFPDEAS